MTLTPGQSLGPYEIAGPLGAGGMGEVYRARDPRLGREVAIKVLPAGLATDAERLRRFELEARAASALNHPNLLTVFDVGTHLQTPYLVTELLEGETLQERLREGPLSLRAVVDLAGQIARGLAAAHERGIIHRDLKPANVFVTRDGRAKILDFGLAKLLPQHASAEAKTYGPTVADRTDAGVVLGTAGYMSPEQVRGEPADQRSDLFALGCILFEMLTSRGAFHRQTAAETMTAILKEDPLASTADPLTGVPPAFVRLVEHCLAKRREDRFQSATDLIFALENISTPATGISTGVVVAQQRVRDRRIAIVAATAVMILVGAAVAARLWRAPAPSATDPVRLHRIALALPPQERLSPLNIPPFSLSPDGKQLAYTAERAGVRHLFVRALDTLDARALPGTEGAHGSPFFSPDGQWIGFFARGKLKKVAVTGGDPIPLSDVPYG